MERTYRLLIGGMTVLDTFCAAELQPALRTARLLAEAHVARGWHGVHPHLGYQLRADCDGTWAPVSSWGATPPGQRDAPPRTSE